MLSHRVLALGAAALFVVSACGGSANQNAGQSSAAAATTTATAKASPISIKSSYGNVTPANLAPFMAQELGLFAKHGLDVDLQLIDGGTASAAALVSGQTQFGNFGGTETMSGVIGGSDMEAITLFVPVTPWQFLAKSDYKSPADLKGKVVGVASIGGSAYVAAQTSLQGLGVDPKADVNIQAFGSTANLTKGMLGGAAYAGPGHPPDTVALLAGGFKVIYDLASQKVPATDNCTVVLKSWATSHKDVVQAYVDAEIEAIAAAKKDKQKTVEVLAKLLKLDVTKDKDALSQTYDFYVTSIIPAYPHPDVKAFQATRDTLVATNPKAKDFDVTKAIDDSFVADAEKRGVGK
ncbi:MAG TPA: ABC transporter substrate-binding protein [Candidatus Limnocylindria bacterium]